jgi:hypothetical protein
MSDRLLRTVTLTSFLCTGGVLLGALLVGNPTVWLELLAAPWRMSVAGAAALGLSGLVLLGCWLPLRGATADAAWQLALFPGAYQSGALTSPEPPEAATSAGWR